MGISEEQTCVRSKDIPGWIDSSEEGGIKTSLYPTPSSLHEESLLHFERPRQAFYGLSGISGWNLRSLRSLLPGNPCRNKDLLREVGSG